MILPLLKQRCSVREFAQRAIEPAIIDDIIEAGRLAPSGGNEQPWKFGIISDQILIAEIANAAYQQQWIAHAPLLIVLCTVPVSDARGGRKVQQARFPRQAEAIGTLDYELYCRIHQEEHQTKIAGSYMTLVALKHGIGSTWISYFNVDEVATLLNLPSQCLPSEIIAFGYPEIPMLPRSKKDAAEIVFYNRLL